MGKLKPKMPRTKTQKVLKGSQYDYRKAFLLGIKPTKDDKGEFHWQSKTPSGEWLKGPRHPTAWKEVFMDKTGVNPDLIEGLTPEIADTIFAKENLGKMSDYLPTDWKNTILPHEKIPEFKQWLESLEWYKELNIEDD
jgi:hypothetical protein